MPEKRKPGHHSLRKGRVSLPNHIYHVTTVVQNRNPIFAEWMLASAACRTLHRPELWADASCLAWVLMPDHLHCLIQLGEKNNLSALVNRIKSSIARSVNRVGGRTGSVWSAGFHDHALRKDEDSQTVARYIVANPLRAGLVDDVLNYPYWDAIWM